MPDLATLLAALPKTVQVFVLDGSSNGLGQMLQALAGRQGVEAIHLFTHGAPGMLVLGDAVLTHEVLEANRDALAALGAVMAENGDLLVYGCNVAAGALGETFIQALSRLTGADVAASTNITGFGGDWVLEANTGNIETTTITVNNYGATLAFYYGTSGTDYLYGGTTNDYLYGYAGNDYLDGGAGIDTVTIFLGDLRVSTNVLTLEGERAIGTRVSEEVRQVVLGQGKEYIGTAFVVNENYITRQ